MIARSAGAYERCGDIAGAVYVDHEHAAVSLYEARSWDRFRTA
jgi:hypothetical protein